MKKKMTIEKVEKRREEKRREEKRREEKRRDEVLGGFDLRKGWSC